MSVLSAVLSKARQPERINHAGFRGLFDSLLRNHIDLSSQKLTHLQPLNQRHQRAIDLFTDAFKAIFEPIESSPALPLRFTGVDERI